ncbi:MAG: hypothetical protein C3F13_05830 [Anaerolineales bacterium]|nr:MAG: hypothetical protein C3F13_05830 [Anaerolineales bacterium]
MNHQPFREWLLSEETLSAEQDQSLREHLATCEACNQIQASWMELEFIIKDAPQVEPMPGFTRRWQAHLEEYQAQQLARRGWVSIGLTALIAGILVALLIFEVWTLIQDPGPFVIVWLDRVVSIFANYFVLQNLIKSIHWFNPGMVFLGMIFLVGMISFMSVLWLSTYRKLSLVWRVE